MALTQIQIIQSLGESLTWLEKELAWGTAVTELRHLCGRIGELYAALLSNGQMATTVNQKGYDVASETHGRISVKTTAQAGYKGHVSFNPNTLAHVDWIMVLKIDTEEMEIQTLLNCDKESARAMMTESNGKLQLSLGKLAPKPEAGAPARIMRQAKYGYYDISESETGSFTVTHFGEPQSPVRPVLRRIAKDLGVDAFNTNGNPKNTRQLGAGIMQILEEREASSPEISDLSQAP